MADSRRHDDPQADLGDAPHGDVKSVPGIERARNADDGHGVSGKDKTISGRVPGVLGAKGAKADPEGETAEEEDALLGAEGDEKQCDGCADHSPDNAIETLRQDEPALLRLRDDENGEQCPIRLIEVEGERNEQGEEARGGGLGREYRSDPSRGRAFAVLLEMMISAFRRRILDAVIGRGARPASAALGR